MNARSVALIVVVFCLATLTGCAHRGYGNYRLYLLTPTTGQGYLVNIDGDGHNDMVLHTGEDHVAIWWNITDPRDVYSTQPDVVIKSSQFRDDEPAEPFLLRRLIVQDLDRDQRVDLVINTDQGIFLVNGRELDASVGNEFVPGFMDTLFHWTVEPNDEHRHGPVVYLERRGRTWDIVARFHYGDHQAGRVSAPMASIERVYQGPHFGWTDYYDREPRGELP